MKPTPDGPSTLRDVERDIESMVTLDILSEHIMRIGKNCGGIKELATKVDELIDIIEGCPHCYEKVTKKGR